MVEGGRRRAAGLMSHLVACGRSGGGRGWAGRGGVREVALGDGALSERSRPPVGPLEEAGKRPTVRLDYELMPSKIEPSPCSLFECIAIGYIIKAISWYLKKVRIF